LESLEHVDVLIVGAGISGIGAAYRVGERCPTKTLAILEGRSAIGGTWDLFRFPGVRSDSDMFTLCYPFRPWKGSRMLVDGPSIREYVEETAREYGIDRAIRFSRRVVRATWSSSDARWTVEIERTDTRESERMTCGFLFTCTGYYRYDQAYTPDFPGLERFAGQVVHPQFWSDDVDYDDKQVVVIGSGATAVTIVPALATAAAHVTMLQRSPSYVLSSPTYDPMVGLLARILPARAAYSVVHWRNVKIQTALWGLSRRRPALMKRLLRNLSERQLPPGYDVDTHFNPSYNPWDERLCIVADGDLFKAIRRGRASVVTDQIDTFTETGIVLSSGRTLEADLIVTATGLSLQPLGGMELAVDGRDVQLSGTLAYRGAMISGVPNMAFGAGYINQSWTLGADLTARQVCRLLQYMDERGYQSCTPVKPQHLSGSVPFMELSSGYVRRGAHLFPKQEPGSPWYRPQNYHRDRRLLMRAPVAAPELRFARRGSAAVAELRLPPEATATSVAAPVNYQSS
jgi:cation diffusion facilitator CzcD-associated flavoprotein CzcO